MHIIFLLLILLFAYVAWLDLPRAVLLTIILLPTYLLRTTFFGIPTTLLELMLVVVFIVWLLRFVSSRTSKLHGVERSLHSPFGLGRDDTMRWLIPIALLLIAASIGIFIAPETTAALGVWKAYFIEPIAFLLVMISLLRNGSLKKERVLQALGLGALMISVVGIIQWVSGSGIPIPWDIEGRITGVFDYPNALGLYVGPIVTIGLIKLLQTTWSNRNHQMFWVLTTVISIIAIVLAQSEAAWVAIIATLVVYTLSNKRFRKKATIIIAVVAIIILSVSAIRVPVIEKLSLQDYSGQVRVSQWQETWRMLKDRPLFGAGLSGYPAALEPYHVAEHYEIFQYPHNIFLNIWSELGLLGLATFFLLALRVIQSRPSPPRPIEFYALLTMFIHGLVDVPYFKNDLAVLTWLLIALVIYDQTLSSSSKKTIG